MTRKDSEVLEEVAGSLRLVCGLMKRMAEDYAKMADHMNTLATAILQMRAELQGVLRPGKN